MTRINTGSVSAAIDALYGARKLPPTEAIERLHGFLDAISPPGHISKFTLDARDAMSRLINGRRSDGSAEDECLATGDCSNMGLSDANLPDAT